MAGGDEWVQEQLNFLNINFDEADKDKSGSLSMGELHEVLKKSGYTGTRGEVNRIFFNMDEDLSFTVSRAEFEKAIGKLPKASLREMALMRAFKTMDSDSSGGISKSELCVNASMQHTGLTTSEIKDLYRFVRKDDDQTIQYDEFLKVLNFKQSESTLNQLFSKLDKDGSGELSIAEMREAINQEGDLARVRPQLLKVLDKTEKDFKGQKVDFHRFVTLWMNEKDRVLSEDLLSNPYV